MSVWQFWRNPEFVRHARAELRAPRAITVALVVLVISALVGLSCWSAEHNKSIEFFRILYLWLMGIQFVFLGVWCAYTTGQSITRERELKTYDFQRTTRLTPWELIVGKTLGEPVLGYFAVACSLPISLLAGLLAGFSPAILLKTYVLMLAFALFVSLFGLWVSMLVERGSGGAASLLIFSPIGMFFGFDETPFPGFAAISVFPTLFAYYSPQYEMAALKPTLFGLEVPFLLLTLLLYATLGAWVVAMLGRNMKKDRAQIRLLTRWQAVGLVAFLNFLYYAFLDPRKIRGQPGRGGILPDEIATGAVGFNAAILVFIGIATVAPAEKLRVWWRARKAGQAHPLAAEGLGWPWILLSALIAFGMLAAVSVALRSIAPFEKWKLGEAAVQFLAFLVYIARDVLFLQWCNLTRMKRPLFKGFLYLILYYVAAVIVAIVAGIGSDPHGKFVIAALTPFGVFLSEGIGVGTSPGIYVGIAVQLVVILWVLKAIFGRLSRPPVVPEASAA